jgi:hypothetical protein
LWRQFALFLDSLTLKLSYKDRLPRESSYHASVEKGLLMEANWPSGQARMAKRCERLAFEGFQMPKEKWDPRPLVDYLLDNDDLLHLLEINMPANINMSRTEDRKLVQLLSLHVAAGSLYEAQPGVFKYTPEGFEKLKEEARISREARLEEERMSRN